DLNEAVIDIAYCGGVIVGSGKVLNIDSRYSNGEIRDFEQLNLDLSYGNFSARNLGIANIDAKYSNLDVKQLGKRMYADFSYGSFTIKSVSSDFSEVKAEARYGNLNITLPPNMACEVVAENMRYATYKISDQFNAQTSKNNHSYRSLINNGHASRKIIFSGNGYSNLAVKAQ
ncbi:hypothetical protein LJC38_05575, partial [Parabacteroides sp. OttesenSCG-928-K15]|nr:hypothetical protein [Parabacteroides sp. OttesenSCG-928-K15]